MAGSESQQQGPPPTDYLIRMTQFTPTLHRDIYPAIDVKTNPKLKDSVKGKVVLVTGASGGIASKGFVPAFATAGAKAIILVGRTQSLLSEVENTVKKINPSTETMVAVVDITDKTKVDALWKDIQEKFGHVDILINNAAGPAPHLPIKEVKDTEQWLSVVDVALRGVLYMVVPYLNILPGSVHGTIINLTSVGATVPMAGVSAYGMSKLVITGLTSSLAVEAPAPDHLTVIALHPGLIDGDNLIPSLRYFAGETNELAGGTALWLCTEEARWLNGKYFNATWDVEEISTEEKRKQVLEKQELALKFGGDFGVQHFK